MTTETMYEHPNPYIGPRSFRVGEQMYGRDREVEELLDLLIAERIVLLSSPSGAGKTSLVHAALIPRLKEEGFEILPTIRVNTEIPLPSPSSGQTPNGEASDSSETSTPAKTPSINRYMLSVIMSLEEELPEHLRLSIEDRIANPSLEYYLQQRQDMLAFLKTPPDISASDSDDENDEDDDSWDDEDDMPKSELFIFDQFEEILTTDIADKETKIAFFTQLRDVFRSRDRWALFCMRDDYIAALDPYLRYIPTRFKNSFHLEPLDVSSACKAIQQPAQDVGVELVDRVVQRLVDNLRQIRVQRSDGSIEAVLGQYVEPVHLQVVCNRLWNYIPADKNIVEEKDLEAIPSLGDIDTVLGNYYADSVADVAAHYHLSERVLREWVDKFLITEQETRGQVMQESGSTRGIPNEAIKALIDIHLLRAERRRGITWFELSHDRLINPVHDNNTQWFEDNLSTLQRQAALWQAQDYLEGFLLQGKALAEAEAWAKDHANDLLPVEQNFLQECRQARELVLKEERRNNQMRSLAIGSAIVSIIATVAFIVAIRSLSRANDLTEITESQRLAFAAQGLKDMPETALLLAAEATANQKKLLSESDKRSLLTHQVLRDTLDGMQWKPLSLKGHTDTVRQADFSPDGQFVVTASDDTTARVWTVDGNLVTTLKGHKSQVVQARFSPDNRYIVTASADSTAIVWKLDGSKVTTLQGHTNGLIGAMFTPNSRRIITFSVDRTTRVWNMDGKEISRIPGQYADVSSDGRHLVTGSSDGIVRLWTLAGKLEKEMKGHTGVLLSTIFSPDGKKIASTSSDKTARIWNIDGTLQTVLRGHKAPVQQALFSTDGQWIITMCQDNIVRIWDQQGILQTTIEQYQEGVTGMALDPNGNYLVTTSKDHAAKVWRMHDPEPSILQGHTDSVQNASFSADGNRIITTSGDNTARIWTFLGNPLPSFQVDTEWIRSARYIQTTREQAPVTTIQVILWNWQVQEWDNAGNFIRNDDEATETIRKTVSKDGKFSAKDLSNGTIELLDADQTVYAELVGHTERVIHMEFSPDEKYFATTSWDKTARIWNVADGTLKAVLKGHQGGVNDVDFSPDGEKIATVSTDQTVRLWNIEGKLLNTLQGHHSVVVDVEFSPNGKYLVTASWDRTARLWSVTGEPMSILTGHKGRLQSASFSPDGQRVITTGQDNMVRQYVVSVDDLLNIAVCRTERTLTARERAKFDLEEQNIFLDQYQCPPPFLRLLQQK